MILCVSFSYVFKGLRKQERVRKEEQIWDIFLVYMNKIYIKVSVIKAC